ncbi:hypothetical protein ACSX1A_08390 [Pontibacter sp. MBLB2868]|uniref:hypothetical protein n=1 Tax=Pontibacter sp. MBLB2868 TaxID=3451555 RepID=UPI003F754905
MMLYSTNSLLVNYDAEKECLYLKRNANPRFDEFRQSMEHALLYAEKHHVKKWLFDFTANVSLNEQEEMWLQTSLFPKLMIGLGTANYIAFVLSEFNYQTLLEEAGQYGLKSYNSFIVINTFCQVEEASDWLENHFENKAD